MAALNWVDYILIAIFIFSIMAGLARGLVREIIALATLVAAFIIAVMFTNPLAEVFTSSPSVKTVVSQTTSAIGVSTQQPVSYAAIGISFLLLFAGTVLIGSLLGYFINFAFQTGVLGIGNRLLGGVFGFIRGFIITLVIVFIVQLTPFSKQNWWQRSLIVVSYQPAILWLANIVSPSLANLKEKLGETFQDMNTQIQGMTTQERRE